MQNIVGSPARGEDFFDREDLVELLWSRLETGNVLLAAPRRFGKTSVMYRLLDHPRPSWKPIHVDAESIREPVNFVLALLDALMADEKIRNFLRERWRGTCSWLRGLLEEAAFSGPWGLGAKIKLKAEMGPEWQERGEALLRVLRDYDGHKRVLVIIDELPVMLYLFRDNGVKDSDARAFLYWFRKLRTDPRVGLTNCRFLVGGSIGIEHYLSQLNAAAAFNDFERVALSDLSPSRAAELLAGLLDARKLKLSRASQCKVLDLVGAAIPYFIQLFVSEIGAAAACGQRTLGPKCLEALYDERVLGAACKTYFQHYYDRLCHYDKPQELAAKEILKTLAIAYPEPLSRDHLRGLFRKTQGETAVDEGFARLLGDLENDFYVRQAPGSPGYSFASKILCDWWRRYYAF